MKNIVSYVDMLNESSSHRKLDDLLIRFVKEDDLKACEALIEAGANPNSITEDEYFLPAGTTAMHEAIAEGNEKVLSLMLQNGADPNALDGGERVPLLLAAGIEDSSIIKLLVEYGADLESRSKDGLSALHVAALEGSSEVCEFLVEEGMDVNATDKKNWTPLHYAVWFDHLNCIEILLKAGANPNIEDKARKTPTSMAKNFSDAETLKVLLKNGGNPFPLFADINELLKFFGGDISWWENAPETVVRVSKVAKTFGK